MIDGSEKRNRQLAFEFQNSMFVKSAVNMTHGTMNSLAIILQSTDLFYSFLLLPP